MKFPLSKKSTYYPVAVIALVLFGWFFFFSGSGSQAQILVVHPQVFAQQLSISGTVQAAQEVDLGFAASGRISGVYAQVGDTVAAGTLLAQTDNGDLHAALAQKQAALAAQQAQLASLQAGTRPEQLAVTQAQIASDQSALAQTNTAVINAIQNAYTQSDDAIHNKVDQFFNNPRSSTPTLLFNSSDSQLGTTLGSERVGMEMTLATWQAQVATLSSSDDLSGAENGAQAALTQVMKLLSDANSALNTGIPTGQVTQTMLNSYITSVATARANVNTAQISLTSAITAQKAAALALAKDQKNLALEQAGSTPDDIAAQEAQVAAAQADVQNAQAQLNKTIVTAPFAGTVTRMDAKVGQVIAPTSQEISMISSGLFQIQTFVPEVELVGLAVGNAATTTLDAYGPDVPFAAKVIAIDPAKTQVNGTATYKTTLRFLAPDPRIKSGMTANVVVTTSVSPGALVVPQGALFQRNGQQMLQLQRGGEIVDVPVQASSTSALGNVQITSGLSDGDRVVLNPNITK